MGRWIKVENELPKKDTDVWATQGDGSMPFLCNYWADDFYAYLPGEVSQCMKPIDVKYWMPYREIKFPRSLEPGVASRYYD